jgi:hypothetical protein
VNWEAISAIGQLVGALAVVISLIYLATEVRSNVRATQQAAMRATLDSFNRLGQQLTQDPGLGGLYYRGLQDFESLEGVDRTRFGVGALINRASQPQVASLLSLKNLGSS